MVRYLNRKQSNYAFASFGVNFNSYYIKLIEVKDKYLIQSCLLAKEEELKLKEQLRELAFKDQAFVEYSSIKTINRYPQNHPLRKYENITKSIEDILCNFIANENSEF